MPRTQPKWNTEFVSSSPPTWTVVSTRTSLAEYTMYFRFIQMDDRHAVLLQSVDDKDYKEVSDYSQYFHGWARGTDLPTFCFRCRDPIFIARKALASMCRPLCPECWTDALRSHAGKDARVKEDGRARRQVVTPDHSGASTVEMATNSPKKGRSKHHVEVLGRLPMTVDTLDVDLLEKRLNRYRQPPTTEKP